MLDTVLKIADIVIKTINLIVKIIVILLKAKNKHQKSNRSDQS